MIGMVVAVLMYSPKRSYRLQGRPTGIPYRGWKRWHWILGMVFGLATVTWTFSGLMTLGPFPMVQRIVEPLTQPSRGAETEGRGPGGRGGGGQNIAAALRGRVSAADFASVHPRGLLERVPDLDVRELQWSAFAGRPILSANLAGGQYQLLSPEGVRIDGFDRGEVVDLVMGAVADPDRIEIELIEQYDLYYLDRRREAPLPVFRVLTNDPLGTRYYVDPASGNVVGTYNSRAWVNRWLYSALHSLDFPFLHNYRPLWDIVVIAFMLGGTGLCVTSLVLAWRTLGRKLRRVAADDLLPRET
jgi:hypothetical protein